MTDIKLKCPVCGNIMKSAYGGFGIDNKFKCEKCESILYAERTGYEDFINADFKDIKAIDSDGKYFAFEDEVGRQVYVKEHTTEYISSDICGWRDEEIDEVRKYAKKLRKEFNLGQ